MDLCIRDLIDRLREEKYKNACPQRIRHAIRAGHLARPRVDGSLNFRFSEENVRQVKAYLDDVPPKGPRRPKPETATA
jgi:hypothetical protein